MNLFANAKNRPTSTNAYREDKTITSVKYDTKKGLYTVAATTSLLIFKRCERATTNCCTSPLIVP